MSSNITILGRATHGLTPEQILELANAFQALFGVDPRVLGPAQIRQRTASRVAYSNEIYDALRGLMDAQISDHDLVRAWNRARRVLGAPYWPTKGNQDNDEL